MKPAHTFFVSAAVALTLSACDKRDPVANEANNTAGLPSLDHVAGAKVGRDVECSMKRAPGERCARIMASCDPRSFQAGVLHAEETCLQTFEAILG